MGYLARASPDGAAAFARSLDDGHVPFLWVTSRVSAPLADGGRVLRVNPAADALGGVDPKRLGDLRSAASSFMESHPGGILIMDCLDMLAAHNGVERVVRAIEGMHDDATVKAGTLIVFVDPRTANPRLVAWLERELEDLPVLLTGQTPDDLLAA